MLDLFAYSLKYIFCKKEQLIFLRIQQIGFGFLRSLEIVLNLTAARISFNTSCHLKGYF